jgi:hypothetical protein
LETDTSLYSILKNTSTLNLFNLSYFHAYAIFFCMIFACGDL